MAEKQTFLIGKDSWIMNKMKIQRRMRIPIIIKEKSRMMISILISTSQNMKLKKKRNSMVEIRKRVK